jgi:Rrf2 family protein
MKLQINRKTDYALRALLDLAFRQKSETVTPLSEISRRQKIPETYLEQIMLLLKRAGFVDSKRGIGGGFFLSRDPADFTVGKVLQSIAGPLEIKAGTSDPSFEEQALQEIWANVNQSISTILAGVTFADIMCRIDELRTKNSEFNYII